MGMLYHIHIVMIYRVGFGSGESRRLMDRHKVIYTNHHIHAAADESEIVRNGQYRHSFTQTLQGSVELFFSSGIDIGGGHWDNVKTNFLWGAACFALHIGDLFVPNSDSIGLFPGLNDVDAMFALNYCIATRSVVEIAGKLSENPDHPRLPALKKAACHVNNGQELWLLDYD